MPVGTDRGWESIRNTIGAGATGGGSTYGDSVNEGVDEQNAYLTKRAAARPDAHFVLGGYSQGAQVVGEAYNEKLSNSLRGCVVYQALFGDPKLFLPEGTNYLPGAAPVACLDKTSDSEWRFDVPNCEVFQGSLGSRIPYLPHGFTSATGLSCAPKDFVCGSSRVFWDNNGHMNYWGDSQSIDKAAAGIAKRLKPLLPAGQVNDSVTLPASGATGLDVVFLIDSTGSMWGRIDATKAFAAEMADTIKANRGRVALIEYKDAGEQFSARILSGFQEDTQEFSTQLSTIYASGGGDRPEAALHALMTAFNGLEWRNGATKAAVVLTDPVNVYPGVSGVFRWLTHIWCPSFIVFLEGFHDGAHALKEHPAAAATVSPDPDNREVGRDGIHYPGPCQCPISKADVLADGKTLMTNPVPLSSALHDSVWHRHCVGDGRKLSHSDG
ncbi:hypothetical protein CXX84_11735 [Arthrobacter sp. AFG7.2]|uniref:cutinase family protein n=1 Tax=Arthrobacter sp. AFG7.2 TaxID=1688693 RepID=UPI000C9E7439|nr:cutinase family protein [Arthrobacter sp. AFG7.2]PNI08563.1 hypothetical protein CXX84_11735 [Arthrobacter sp. AFG7.2]